MLSEYLCTQRWQQVCQGAEVWRAPEGGGLNWAVRGWSGCQFCLSLLAVGLLVFARAFPPEPERQWASWLVDLKRPTRFW
eukprot:scaffold143147_cov14-Tisochrysis_lutea.AAC.2